MPTSRLRRVGGSTMVAIPPTVLEAAHLSVDSVVQFSVDDSGIHLAVARPQYTLEELLAQCDFDVSPSEEERAWVSSPAVGRELI